MKDIAIFEKLPPMSFKPDGEFESLKESERKILAWCERLVKTTALFAFNIGKELVLMKENLKHGEFISWVEEKFPFTKRTAQKYMKFFAVINCGDFSISSKHSMSEALREAGVTAPKAKNDDDDEKFDFLEMFEHPVNKAGKPQNCKVFADLLTEIIVVSKNKDNYATSKRFVHFCEDVPIKDPELFASYKEMVYKIKAAVEEYLFAVEQEESGRG